jgi:hypothetical protein
VTAATVLFAGLAVVLTVSRWGICTGAIETTRAVCRRNPSFGARF